MFEQLSTELHRTGLQIIIKATDFQREMLRSIHNCGGIGLAPSTESSIVFCQREFS